MLTPAAEISTIESISNVNSTIDRLLGDKIQLQLADVQDHMDDTKMDFFNELVRQAVNRC
jgi:hypothetical protein